MQAVVGALRAVLGLDSVAFEKGADDAKKKLSSLEKSFNQFGGNVSAVGTKLSSVLAALGVGLSLGGLLAFRKHLNDSVGSLGELAEQLGISTDALQAYQFMAGQMGVEQKQLEASIIKFNKVLGDAASGDKTAVDFFKDLKVKIFDVNGQLRPTEDNLRDTAKAIDAMGSGAEKTSKANDGFGKSGARLIPMFAELSKGINANVQAARDAGQVIESDVIKHFDDAADRATALKKKFDTLAASFVFPIEAAAIDRLTAEVSRYEKALEKAELEVGKGNVGWQDRIALLQTASRFGVDEVTRAKELEAVVQRIIEAKQGANAGGLLGAAAGDAVGDKAAQAAMEATLRQRKADEDEIRRLEGMIADRRKEADETDSPAARVAALRAIQRIEETIAAIRATTPIVMSLPPVVVTPTTNMPYAPGVSRQGGYGPTPETAGGKFATAKATGQSPEEKAKQNLDAWKTEMKDFQASLKELEADSAAPLEDVEKRLESQRRLTERIRQGLKGLPEGSPLAEQIREQAKATEEARFAFEDYMRAAKDADTAEKAYGDGSKVLAQTQRDLAEAYKTGRLSVDAQRLALDEATRSAELQRLKMIGLTDQGWGGFIAGIQTAKLEWDRANNTFAAGQAFFESTMSNMTTALEQFVATGKLSFRSLASSIIGDLIKMQLKAASTGLFGLLGQAFSSLFGGSSAGTLDGYTSTSLLYGGPRAGGGPVLAGMPYMVGEHGPELMVPSRAGNIIPNDALGMGGGVNITQSFTIHGGDEAGTMRALNRVMPQMKKEVLDAVQDARSRGGKFSQTFRQ